MLTACRPKVAEVDRSTYKRLSRPGFNSSIVITQAPVKCTSPQSKDVSTIYIYIYIYIYTHT